MEQYTYLAHHGTKGMRWGHRRYQNPDGSYTELGREHYGIGNARDMKRAEQVEAYKKKIKKFAANSVNSNVQNAFNTAGKAAMLTFSTSIGQAASKYLPSLSTAVVSAGKNAVSAMLASGIDPVAAGIIGTAAVTTAYVAKKSFDRDQTKKVVKENETSHVNSAKQAIAELKFMDENVSDDASYDRYVKTLGPLERFDANFYRRENKKDYQRFARQAATSIKSLRASGHTISEIAKMLGVSESTVSKYSSL